MRFKFRLALALGRTVSELEEQMSPSEFIHWMAYYRLEPFGQERDNLHAGIIASTIVNVNSPKRPYKAHDFMVVDQATRAQEKTTKFVAGLRALASPKTDKG